MPSADNSLRSSVTIYLTPCRSLEFLLRSGPLFIVLTRGEESGLYRGIEMDRVSHRQICYMERSAGHTFPRRLMMGYVKAATNFPDQRVKFSAQPLYNNPNFK